MNLQIIILTLFLALNVFPLHAQITGKVVDAENNSPLPGAVVHSGDKASITGKNGNFSLELQKKDEQTLEVSYLGYKTKSIEVSGSQQAILIEMFPVAHALEEIVIASSVFSQKLKSSPGSFHLLTGDVLEDHREINIAKKMNEIPGVFMASGAHNTNRLTIRGIGSRTPYNSNRIRAYLDGIPLTSGDGITTIEDIDASGLGRIEILKGPSSAVYGSGLGGVVRMYSANPQRNGFDYRLRSQYGKFNTLQNTVNASYKQDNASILANYNYSGTDGYRQNNEYNRHSLLISGNQRSMNSSIQFTVSFTDLRAEIPSSLNEDDFLNNPQNAAQNWLAIEGYEGYRKFIAGVTWEQEISERLSNSLTVFTSLNDHYEPRPFNTLADFSFSKGLREEINYQLDHVEMLAGVELYHENFNWQIYETLGDEQGALLNDNSEVRKYFNTFFHARYQPGNQWTIEAGLNLNALNYTLEDDFTNDGQDNSGNYSYDPVLSPRVGINWSISPGMNLYSSLGHGFSAPSLEETLLPEGQVNTTLKPEEGWNVDLGSRGHLFDERVYYDLSLYYIRLRNLLVTKRVTEEIFTGINAGETHHQGLEFFLKYNVFRPEIVEQREWTFSASYTISENRFLEFTDEGVDYSGNELPGIPRQMLNLRSELKFLKKIHLSTDLRYTGEQFINDANDRLYESYLLLDLGLRINELFTTPYLSLNLFGGVRNLFDEHYASMILVNAPSFGGSAPRYYYPGMPRRFYVGVGVGLP